MTTTAGPGMGKRAPGVLGAGPDPFSPPAERGKEVKSGAVRFPGWPDFVPSQHDRRSGGGGEVSPGRTRTCDSRRLLRFLWGFPDPPGNGLSAWPLLPGLRSG